MERLKLNGARLPFGLYRLWEVGSSALSHQDVLRREIPNLPDGYKVKIQFGINLYLSNEVGGELEIWNKKINDVDWDSNATLGSYGFNRSLLGEPDFIIQPKSGDLIIIDSECVHAVNTVREKPRLTLSGFAGYTCDDQPLRCWS